ncbi:N-acyl homoserine lactonase family protein [Pullulanibacillus camelliae]|uniref:N-acyl homoserine lactonase family protein n=1 Tax=Pullulanibacillus camelliae TaxID=1707096 RepID=A0A8J2VKG3_9BACL|nr:N-acyl homoserine lactonase family protein [Pullulanibacillus camelliae]GGE28241.1 N-acyl homoserine lactonase family protein [Pullulanibacillus camelliae]
MKETPQYEVYAIKYSTREAVASEHFYGHADPHENYSMPMDYYIWLIKAGTQAIVVDTGFSENVAKERKRTFLRCPTSVLKKLEVDPASVPLVIITHMHYDHLGNLDKFPNSTFVVQESEMAFWTGKYASKPHFLHHITPEDVVYLVQENFKGKVQFVNGSEEIMPGITVHRTGGHSAGLQIVEVKTEKGNVVLASDVTHYYKNINEDRPFWLVTNLPEMYEGFDLVKSLADTSELIIPGHDPAVMNLFPAAGEGLEGIAVRIA